MIKNSTRGTSYTLHLPSTGYLPTEASQQRGDTFVGHALHFRVDKMGLLQAAKELLWGILSDLGHYLSIMTRKMNSVVKKGTCISNKIGDVINYKTRYMFFNFKISQFFCNHLRQTSTIYLKDHMRFFNNDNIFQCLRL